jgi:GcrA cell cycle regulator
MLWTSERDHRIIVLWADGLSASEIARDFGDCSRNAVIGRVYRLRASGYPLEARSSSPARSSYHRRSPAKSNAARSRPRRPPKPPPLVEPTPPSLDKLIPFLDVRNGLCRWPHGDPQQLSAFRFCGEQTCAHVYCDYHWAHARQSTLSISTDERERRRHRALRLYARHKTQAGSS